MLELIAINMAPIMFASLIVFLLLGYPVAFSLAANGLLFFAVGVWLAPLSSNTITLDWPLLFTMPARLWGVMSNETLLAIPFFTFMGFILEKSGMAEDLLDTIGQLFGPVRGGLAYAVIFVGALLGGPAGVVAATVISMGLISLPIMLRYGYDRRVASGVIAASGTLAQIIPPSLVLIVLADQMGKSVGDMYLGSLVPSLVLTGLYMVYVMIMTIIRPSSMPALPPEARTLGSGATSLFVALGVAALVAYLAHLWLYDRLGADADVYGALIASIFIYFVAILDRKLKTSLMSRLAQEVIIVMMPPMALIFLVLGTIFLGIATPTEGAAMGAASALLLTALKGRLTWSLMYQAVLATTKLTSFVMFILLGARVFSLSFYGVNGHLWVEHLLTSLPGGQLGFLIVVSILVFFLAFFLDFFELAFIIVPLLAPAATALGIDLIWFGVILGVNMQTSFMHPPFGFALFYLRSVAPRGPYTDKVTGERLAGVTTGQIYWGAVPFVLIQVLMVGITIAFPSMVMHYKGNTVDPSTIEIKVPTLQTLAPGGTTGGATLGAPKLGAPTLGAPDAEAPVEGGAVIPALPGPKLGAPVVNP